MKLLENKPLQGASEEDTLEEGPKTITRDRIEYSNGTTQTLEGEDIDPGATRRDQLDRGKIDHSSGFSSNDNGQSVVERFRRSSDCRTMNAETCNGCVDGEIITLRKSFT